MAEGAGGEVREQRVVFRVWGRHHHGRGPRLPEHDALHERQTIGVEMLDNLDQRGGIGIGPSIVAVGQGAMQQRYPALRRATRQMQLQPLCRPLQFTRRRVKTDQPLGPSLAEQTVQQLALAAAQIGNGLGAGRTKRLRRLPPCVGR